MVSLNDNVVLTHNQFYYISHFCLSSKSVLGRSTSLMQSDESQQNDELEKVWMDFGDQILN